MISVHDLLHKPEGGVRRAGGAFISHHQYIRMWEDRNKYLRRYFSTAKVNKHQTPGHG